MTDISGRKRILEVLLVEDSPGDIRLMQETFKTAHTPIRLHVATDGVDAMSFLRREGINAGAARPDFILLDLNLPKMDGREVLAHIKADQDLKTIPTVILTTSDAEADVLKSYQLQANAYLNKPVALDAFEGLVKTVTEFWLRDARLPQQPA
jgi:chemotaxis family two-component system response regulator Rcp1